MRASDNTGLSRRHPLSLSLTYIQSLSSIINLKDYKNKIKFNYIKLKNKLSKDDKKIRKIKKYC
jgi:hypothetical protein